MENWKSQIVTSNFSLKMGLRKAPYAFTEQGIAMLSGVLNSDRAIKVNIAIMRVFVRLKSYLATHRELAERLAALEKEVIHNKADIQTVFSAIRALMEPEEKPKPRIGFVPPEAGKVWRVRERVKPYGNGAARA